MITPERLPITAARLQEIKEQCKKQQQIGYLSPLGIQLFQTDIPDLVVALEEAQEDFRTLSCAFTKYQETTNSVIQNQLRALREFRAKLEKLKQCGS